MKRYYTQAERIARRGALILLLFASAVLLSAFGTLRPPSVITVINGGEVKSFCASASTVEEALRKGGITLSPQDLVIPPASAPINRFQTITLAHVEQARFTRVVSIPNEETETIRSSGLPEGQSLILRAGRDGRAKEMVEITRIGGRKGSKRILERTILEQPIPCQILVGTGPQVSSAKTAFTSNANLYNSPLKSRKAEVQLADKNKKADSASTVMSGYGAVAADPAFLPVGSRVYVEGYGFAVAVGRGTDAPKGGLGLCVDEPKDRASSEHLTVAVHRLD